MARPNLRALLERLGLQIADKPFIDTKHEGYSRWAKPGIDPNDVSGSFACQRLHRRRFSPGIRPRFKVDTQDRLFAIGSCFARGIETAFQARGFCVESAAKDFNRFRTLDGESVTALGFTNKYTTYSILNELSWALDPKANFPEASLVDMDDKRTIDPHINPTLQAVDRIGTLERRAILQQVNSRIRECRVVFITLGLVEVWYDAQAGVHINTTPTREMRERFPSRYQPFITDYVQNLDNMHKLYALLREHGHKELQIVVTTSPVPLNLTVSDQDVVIANTYSKSTLRAVAQDFATRYANVQYFPSYEIVMNSRRDAAWEDDLRHVRGAMTQHVMDQFMFNFVES